MATTNILSQDTASSLSGDASSAAQTSLSGMIDGWIKTISDGIDLVNKISDNLPQDARSIIIEVVNLTSRNLTKGSDSFSHGGLSSTLPNLLIAPFAVGVFSVSSDGIATGVEGNVSYTADGAGEFSINFDNPFVGSNGMGVNSSPGTDAQISIIGEISTGNHAHARFTIIDRSDPYPNRQSDWRSCSKCQSLYYGPFKGVCAKGGTHDPTGSFNYFSIYQARATSTLQDGWRSCSKCQSLHYAGLGAASCAKGGSHDDAGSFSYDVMFNCQPSTNRQTEWGSCIKCRQLFYRPKNGTCAGGGVHDGQNSFDYACDFV